MTKKQEVMVWDESLQTTRILNINALMGQRILNLNFMDFVFLVSFSPLFQKAWELTTIFFLW